MSKFLIIITGKPVSTKLLVFVSAVQLNCYRYVASFIHKICHIILRQTLKTLKRRYSRTCENARQISHVVMLADFLLVFRCCLFSVVVVFVPRSWGSRDCLLFSL